MNYWWVNHKQTYKDERGGNYIWSPQRNKDGSANQTYTNLTKVRPGDIVFSYANGVIGALGVAADQYFQSDRPVSFGEIGEQWDKNGWKVPVNWTQLSKTISPKDHLTPIGPLLPERHSPIQRQSGNGNQGCYLASISAELGTLLISLSTRDGNLEIKDSLRDLVESITDEKEERRIKADPTLPETTREALIKARIGQGQFRDNVECRETGCRVTAVTDKRFLIASHMKPWHVSSNEERLDGANGLLLSPHIDKLFDHGWISFADNGDLLVASECPADVLAKWKVKVCAQRRPFSNEQKRYLRYHREQVFGRRNATEK